MPLEYEATLRVAASVSATRSSAFHAFSSASARPKPKSSSPVVMKVNPDRNPDAVLALAKNLDITVVAEGVETPAQLAVLLQLQCPYLQGYLFSRPRPSTDLAELVETHEPTVVGIRDASA